MPEEIDASKQLIVEGDDEELFCVALLEHMGLREQFQIRNVKGNTRFRGYLKAVVNQPGFGDVTGLGILRDAEEDFDATHQSVRDDLRHADLPAPDDPGAVVANDPDTGYYLLPNNTDSGMLEDLCLSAVAEEEVFECVETFLDCVEEADDRPRNASKAKTQAYLAAQDPPVRFLAVGAHRNHWNLDHPAFDSLKDFIRAL